MRQFAIIGLSRFGRKLLEELIDSGAEILIIDKDSEVIDLYKDKVAASYIADAISEEIIQKLIPATIDAAVIDLGGRMEVSILVTNYLKKMGIKEIIAKADSDEHGEILELVGATRVVFPNQEAASRIAPMLLSSLIFSYLPISNDLVIAEIRVPAGYAEKTLIEADLRRTHRLNVIAIRKVDVENYLPFSPEYRLQAEDILLVGGTEEDLALFTEEPIPLGSRRLSGVFRRFFRRKN